LSAYAISLEKSHLRSQAWALQYEMDNGHIPEARMELHALANAVRERNIDQVLERLTDRNATFTRGKLEAALMYGGMMDNHRERGAMMREILRHDDVIKLQNDTPTPQRGVPDLFTTRQVVRQEREIRRDGVDLEKSLRHQVDGTKRAATSYRVDRDHHMARAREQQLNDATRQHAQAHPVPPVAPEPEPWKPRPVQIPERKDWEAEAIRADALNRQAPVRSVAQARAQSVAQGRAQTAAQRPAQARDVKRSLEVPSFFRHPGEPFRRPEEPPVKDGYIRMYQGEQPGAGRAPRSYTTDLEKACGSANGPGGRVSYMDLKIGDRAMSAQFHVGNGGLDEWTTKDAKFRERMRPFQPQASAERARVNEPSQSVKPKRDSVNEIGRSVNRPELHRRGDPVHQTAVPMHIRPPHVHNPDAGGREWSRSQARERSADQPRAGAEQGRLRDRALEIFREAAIAQNAIRLGKIWRNHSAAPVSSDRGKQAEQRDSSRWRSAIEGLSTWWVNRRTAERQKPVEPIWTRRPEAPKPEPMRAARAVRNEPARDRRQTVQPAAVPTRALEPTRAPESTPAPASQPRAEPVRAPSFHAWPTFQLHQWGPTFEPNGPGRNGPQHAHRHEHTHER
jgi:hypothetical protein